MQAPSPDERLRLLAKAEAIGEVVGDAFIHRTLQRAGLLDAQPPPPVDYMAHDSDTHPPTED